MKPLVEGLVLKSMIPPLISQTTEAPRGGAGIEINCIDNEENRREAPRGGAGIEM